MKRLITMAVMLVLLSYALIVRNFLGSSVPTQAAIFDHEK